MRDARAPDGSPEAVPAIVEWLSGDECHALDDAGLVAGLGRRLRAAGLPVDRLSLHLRSLHPEIFGRSVAWAPGEPVEILDRAHGIEVSGPFVGGPVLRAMASGTPVRARADDPDGAPWAGLDVFRGRGLAELVVLPLVGIDGPSSAVSVATARPAGFDAGDRAALDRVAPALRTACELRTLRWSELTLLDTYVGAASARRILAGHVRRGQVESLAAALLLCDLRGFTQLSNRRPAAEVLALLDAYFDRVVPAVADGGGEVLKFMGDAVLAYFHRDDPAAACAAALAAAGRVLDRLAAPVAGVALAADVALHYGEVSYGNIGSGSRLDFTVIGPDVNLLSRIEGACGALGRPLLMSGRFAALLGPGRSVPAGAHPLKGFADPVALFAPATG